MTLSAAGFEPLSSHDLVAPSLLWSEVASTLSEATWRGELTPEESRTALDRLLVAPITRRATARLYREALDISRELGWAKTYDAEYVALARMIDSALVTRDARLQRRAGALIEIIGPDEVTGRRS